MAANNDKKADAERRAKALYERLMQIRPEGLSNNQWTAKAGVSTSFFTNMQGRNKPASEPSIGNLRLVLKAIGMTLPEFFLDEAPGQYVRLPTKRALERVLAEALDELPSQPDRHPEYVAEAVLRVLAPLGRRDSNEDGDSIEAEADRAADAPTRAATTEA